LRRMVQTSHFKQTPCAGALLHTLQYEFINQNQDGITFESE